MNVERELKELQEKLLNVEGWRARREEVEAELKKVWVDGGEVLEPPAYQEVKRGPALESGHEVRTDR
jgi:ATP-binding cassette subfamily D (ALD) long-chain fatty acid import protein